MIAQSKDSVMTVSGQVHATNCLLCNAVLRLPIALHFSAFLQRNLCSLRVARFHFERVPMYTSRCKSTNAMRHIEQASFSCTRTNTYIDYENLRIYCHVSDCDACGIDAPPKKVMA
jgi:hypothetical protein